jgi:hypothetical protein
LLYFPSVGRAPGQGEADPHGLGSKGLGFDFPVQLPEPIQHPAAGLLGLIQAVQAHLEPDPP